MKRIIPIVLSSAMLFTGCTATTQNANTPQASVSTVKQNSTSYIMAGMIQPIEKADITSKISAKVMDVTVDIGSHVKKGDPILKLDTKDIAAQVEQAQAGIKTAQANLVKAKHGNRPEQIAQAQSALNSASTSYENAKINYDRMNQLFNSGAISKQQLESSQVQLNTSQAQYNSAKDQLDMLQKGETSDTLSVLESQVKQAQATLDVSKALLSNGIITSPISGIVSVKNINKGEMATPSATLISIVNTSELFINAYLPASLIEEVKVGQEVTVRISELSDKEFKAKISTIDPVIDSKAKNVLVKVKLENPDTQLKPGMFAEIGLKNDKTK